MKSLSLLACRVVLLCNKQKGRVGMKKILSFFLVALVIFTFMGCDSSAKVPTKDQAAEIGNCSQHFHMWSIIQIRV